MVDFESFFRKWTAHIILLVVIVIIFYMVWKDQMRQLRSDGKFPSADGNGHLYYPGRGCEDDNVSTLIARTYWAAYLNKRVVKWERVFIITVFTILILMALLWRRLVSVPKILITGLIVFFVVFMLENFMYVHGDIYNDANIRNNSILLASKLGLNIDFQTQPRDPTCGAPDRVSIMNL